ncbi:MAG: zinc ribbon domain-containing protein [Ruminococcus sp.]|nr:zinc ribbon domain-containing protein [Ruminococcus sp.]
MFCRSCGNKLADNAKFCNLCGSPLDPDQLAAMAGTQGTPAATGAAAPAQTAAAPEKVTMDEAVVPQKMTSLESPQAAEAAAIIEADPVTEHDPSPTAQPGQYQPYQQQYNQPTAGPYQQNYQQPMAQPYPQYQQAPRPFPAYGAAAAPKPLDKPGAKKILAAILFVICAFLVTSSLFKVYGVTGKTFYTGTARYLFDLSDAGKFLHKNIFEMTGEMFDDAMSAVLIIGFWAHALFEILAAIYALAAFFRLFSKNYKGDYRLWADLAASAAFSFFGNLLSFAGVAANNIKEAADLHKGIFEWAVKPNVLAYLFLAGSLTVMIITLVIRSEKKRAYRTSSAYNSPNIYAAAPQQQRFQ